MLTGSRCDATILWEPGAGGEGAWGPLGGRAQGEQLPARSPEAFLAGRASGDGAGADLPTRSPWATRPLMRPRRPSPEAKLIDS